MNMNDSKETKDIEEYGVVFKKIKKLRHKIFPQKGKKPDKEDESYKIV